ncbi:hypothetical protein VTN31DRAFT_3046 [Thermomyces dupontii]|uniref:uncharacterized protein n=1 Tax=Talaromyces thermophilus TaxID=28565 RepID=UPI0037433603
MFAVPGWSVSAADLKPQTETPAAQSISTSSSEKPRSQSKKRKRGQNKNGDKVTGSNVDEMFRRHIQGDSMPYMNGDSVKEVSKGSKKDNQKNRDSSVKRKGETNEETKGKSNKKQKKAHDAQTSIEEIDTARAPANAIPPPPPPQAAKLTPLQQKMRDKLVSARFRYLNETLYTSPSSKALEMFSNNPEFFAEYHAGFSKQVKESWPSNPVDGYIQMIRSRANIPVSSQKGQKGKSQQRAALPRRPNGFCTIADLGCGDAQLARALIPSADKLKLKFLNYDLHDPDPLITKADISNLPLPDGSVDIAIFCLSLMGTNWISFVEEAWRVLRSDGKGECWVSEVKSRFGKVHRKKGPKKPESNRQKKKMLKKKKGKADDTDMEDDSGDEEIYAEDALANPQGQDETDISAFVDVMNARGFRLKPDSVDKSNKMFVRMEFVKQSGAPTRGKYAGVTPGRPAAAQSTKRFIDAEDGEELTPEEEAKVLKPCVYKTR